MMGWVVIRCWLVIFGLFVRMVLYLVIWCMIFGCCIKVLLLIMLLMVCMRCLMGLIWFVNVRVRWKLCSLMKVSNRCLCGWCWFFGMMWLKCLCWLLRISCFVCVVLMIIVLIFGLCFSVCRRMWLRVDCVVVWFLVVGCWYVVWLVLIRIFVWIVLCGCLLKRCVSWRVNLNVLVIVVGVFVLCCFVYYYLRFNMFYYIVDCYI